MIRPFIHLFIIHSFIHLFIHSFIHAFIHSFIHGRIRSESNAINTQPQRLLRRNRDVAVLFSFLLLRILLKFTPFFDNSFSDPHTQKANVLFMDVISLFQKYQHRGFTNKQVFQQVLFCMRLSWMHACCENESASE